MPALAENAKEGVEPLPKATAVLVLDPGIWKGLLVCAVLSFREDSCKVVPADPKPQTITLLISHYDKPNKVIQTLRSCKDSLIRSTSGAMATVTI